MEFNLSEIETVCFGLGGQKPTYWIEEKSLKKFIRLLKKMKHYGSGDFGGADVVRVKDIDKLAGPKLTK